MKVQAIDAKVFDKDGYHDIDQILIQNHENHQILSIVAGGQTIHFKLERMK